MITNNLLLVLFFMFNLLLWYYTNIVKDLDMTLASIRNMLYFIFNCQREPEIDTVKVQKIRIIFSKKHN